jgi:hypothetical protein
MEYPCLFTTAVDWLTPGRSLDPEFLTVHECGHQFWYGLVGNDEIRYPWLDEGINSYADTRCLNAAYGADVYVKDYLSRAGFSIPIAFSAVRLDQRTRRLNRFRRTLGGDPMNLPTWEYRNGDSYGNNAYDKPALLLWTLESVLGEQVFSDIMKTYAERYSFKHPAPRDFIDVIDEYSEEPIDWLFDQLFDGPGVLDYAVVKLDRKTIKGPSGFFTEAEGIEFRKPTENKENTIQTTIVLERRGDLKIPVDIHIRFADGETAIERWDGADVWKRLVYVRDVEVERVDIDPERKLVLDVDYANNSMYGKKEPYAALKWALRWMFWLQHFFEVAAFFS